MLETLPRGAGYSHRLHEALETIGFQGPFHDRGVVYRCTSHVQPRSGDSCAMKESSKARPGVYRQGGRHSHHNGPIRGDKRASLHHEHEPT